MSYIFRLHNEGNNTLTDWGVSTRIGTTIIEQIQDPNGETAKREITSIPSPFARIDLVKTAFGKVAESNNIAGDSIHHKMVSDALDVGQIFFEFDKFRDKFDIIVWDKENDLLKLRNSPRSEHRQLGDTYDTYIQQDGKKYNFDRMERMYFLNFKSGPSEMNIVGATSPATLFFTSANDLSYVSDAIRFEQQDKQDKPFDDDFRQLYQRDFEYQKYWYALQRSVPYFDELFPEIDAYLAKNLEAMTDDHNGINQITRSDYNDEKKYAPIIVGTNAGQTVSIHTDIKLLQRIQNTSNIADVSGFVIKSQNRFDEFLPLVLPVERYTHRTVYTKNVWNQNIEVPFFDPRAIKDRTLPADESKYPYLTISDFLADTIVRMPYEIDSDNFFNGNIAKVEGYSYLLPLTSTFFHFFSVKELTEDKLLRLENNAGGITAVLRIPVRNGVIEYRRTYYEGLAANIEANDGALIDKNFGLGIMPLIRFPENVQKHYRIAMFDKGDRDIKLNFVLQNSNTGAKHVIRKEKERGACSFESYVLEDNFDLIQVTVGNVAVGYVLPLFRGRTGNEQFTFAIDFGTTNTHIEYCTSSNPKNPFAFDISAKDDRQLYKLHRQYFEDKDIEWGFLHNFIPETIGDKDVYAFPMRTVFSQNKNINYDRMPMPLADGNIPFLYEKERTPEYNETKTDLKWSDVPDRLFEMYLETLFILMRNKVALNSGDLSATKIVWFYPASMNEGMIHRFKDNWETAYKRYFGENVENVISISESMAPYSYYSQKQGARRNVVTIDVGGGTTDVFVVENREPKMLLSFRFASNAIFGDGYNWDSDNNGFVNLYKEKFEQILASNGLLELQQALIQIESQKKSSDIVAFLFSLVGERVNGNPALNFLQKLSADDRMRYVFIIFYASILYFIAKSMKAKGLSKPLTLAFSGNGSHSLNIVSNEKKMIARFAQLIFDGVYADGLKGEIQIIMEENPKKATCKGGILSPESQEYETIENIKTVLIGNYFDGSADKKLTYAEISPDVKEGVLTSVKEFFNFLFDLHKNNNDFLGNKLAADPAIFEKVKKICLNDTTLSQSLSDGLYHKRKEKEVTDDTKVEETLFFYPLVNILHDLALKISEMK